MNRPPLVRATDDRILAGVCAGLAAHLAVPVAWVRIAFAVLALAAGAGPLLYIWLWVTVPPAGALEPIVPLRRALTRPAATDVTGPTAGAPAIAAPAAPTAPSGIPDSQTDESGTAPAPEAAPRATPDAVASAPAPTPAPTRFTRWPVAELLLGAGFLIAGIALVLDRSGVRFDLTFILPALAVLVGVGLTWWQFADRRNPERNMVPRVLGALALVAAGVLMFFVTAREPSALTVIGAAFAVLAGVALAIAPWLLRMNRELVAERSARAREEERSEIAAHLHDSVLQTLALIQQRSAPGSEVARIARGQERELREWLFRAGDGAAARERELAGEELRAHAAALEAEHAVRFEVVEVGSAGIAPEPIIAAAREAMLNAARHAGGDVTVYLEATADTIRIDIADRGPGLDLSNLPDGRMGVRESILGRMERAGGGARIVRGPSGGTSVRLNIPRVAPAATAPDSPEGTPND
ncbi:PspC domain-containing protein [Leucobacter sp. cx-328]|uniref:ATP-binding protein n=1 Tax=unclassified Leucobacter TaxID=2621730 RepID=UPI00165EBC74|nr:MULTISPECIES: ATP-binding protein [unclassified Leucobacter]MBC9944801.1 PspC domain-containing protein [Leucobacter sp. cx-328]